MTGHPAPTGSELLEEDAEPFEVMPRALLSAPLVAALRVLFADAAAFGAWSSLDDALVGWPAGGAAPGPAGGARLAAEHGHALEGVGLVSKPARAGRSAESQQACGADDRTPDDAGAAVQPCGEPAVAANGRGHEYSTASRAASLDQSQPQAGVATQPGCGPAQDGHARQTGQDGAQLGSVSIPAAAHFLPPCALQALHAALLARLSQYRRPGPGGAAAELDRAEATAGKARGVAEREAAGARMAALRLVHGERQLLKGALAALRPLLP